MDGYCSGVLNNPTSRIWMRGPTIVGASKEISKNNQEKMRWAELSPLAAGRGSRSRIFHEPKYPSHRG